MPRCGSAGRKRPDLAERNRQRATHGMRHTPTWKAWSAMRDRCLTPTNKSYPRYGGRGITICDRWESFEAFLADMGERPKGTTLGRIDNDGPYSPDNCRWETARQQANNRRNNVRVRWRGEERTVAEWARIVGLERKTLEYRIRSGWDAERALTTPSLTRRK